MGFTARRGLTPRTCLTAFHLRSQQIHTYGFLQTSPRGNARKGDLPSLTLAR